MKQFNAFLLSLPFVALPLFPSFITLTAVTVPGVSLIPAPVAWTLLATMVLDVIVWVVLQLRRPLDLPPTLVPLLAWFFAALLASVAGMNPRGGLLFIGIFGMGIIWHCGVWCLCRDPFVLRVVLRVFVATGAIASLVAIGMVLLRLPADQYTIGHGRAIGTFILPGELAGYLIILIPIALALALASRDRITRGIGWSAVIAGAVAFALTFSRAGWTGLAAAVAFYLAATRRTGRARYAIVPVALGLATVLAFFNVNHNPSENYTRLSIWQAALDIVQRFPLTGVGPFDFVSAYAQVRLPDGEPTAFHAHSFLLTIFAEMGLVGLAAVSWAWWKFGVALKNAIAIAKPEHVVLALAVAAGLFGTLVQGLIDTVSVVLFGLWLPTMALALVFARQGIGEDPA